MKIEIDPPIILFLYMSLLLYGPEIASAKGKMSYSINIIATYSIYILDIQLLEFLGDSIHKHFMRHSKHFKHLNYIHI